MDYIYTVYTMDSSEDDETKTDQLSNIISEDNLEEFIKLESTTTIDYKSAFDDAREDGSYQIMDYILDKNIDMVIEFGYIEYMCGHPELLKNTLRDKVIRPFDHLELISVILRRTNSESVFEIWRDFYLDTDKEAINKESEEYDVFTYSLNCTVPTFRIFLDLSIHGFAIDKEQLCNKMAINKRDDLITEYINYGFEPCFGKGALEFAFGDWNEPMIDRIVDLMGPNLKYSKSFIETICRQKPNIHTIDKLIKWRSICDKCAFEFSYIIIDFVNVTPEICEWIYENLPFKYDENTSVNWSMHGNLEALQWLYNKSIEGKLEFKYNSNVINFNTEHNEVLNWWLNKIKEGVVQIKYSHAAFENLIKYCRYDMMKTWIESGLPIKCTEKMFFKLVLKLEDYDKVLMMFFFAKHGDQIGFAPKFMEAIKNKQQEWEEMLKKDDIVEE